MNNQNKIFDTPPETQMNFLEKFLAVKVTIIPAVLVFGVMLSLGVAFVVNTKSGTNGHPSALSGQAAELSKRNPPSYGYQNPRVESAQGPVRVPPGSTNVPAHVFVVYAPQDRSITTAQYRISFSNISGVVTKLSLLKDSQILGSKAPLPQSGEVVFNSPVVISAGGSARFTIAADVTEKVLPPPVYGYPTPPTLSVGIQSINYSDSRPSRMDGLPLVNTVTVAASDPVSVSAGLSPSSPIEQQVSAGATNVDTAHIMFQAYADRDVALKQVTIGATTEGRSPLLKNIRVYDRDTNTLLATVPKLDQQFGTISAGIATFSSPLLIPRGATKTLRITTDLAPNQTFGFQMGVVGLAGQDPIIYTGPIPLFGYKINVVLGAAQAELIARLDAATPIAHTINSGDQNVDFTAIRLSAGAGKDVVLEQMSIGLISNSEADSLKNIRIYDGQKLLGSVASLGNKDKNGPWDTIFFKGNLTIAKGSAKTLRVVADVNSNLKPGITIKLGVVGVTYPAPTTVTGLPMYGNTMTIGKLIRRSPR